MECFKKIKLNEIDSIKAELLKSTPEGTGTRSKYFPYNEAIRLFPTLIKEVKAISKLPIFSVKIFVTGPFEEGIIHLDHYTTSRIGLNIPVTGYNNTQFNFFESEKNNLITNVGDKSKGYGISTVPKNLSKIKKIYSLELLEPHLIRTDVLHQAINLNKEDRIIATLRWEANRSLFNFEDFINYELL